LVSKPLVELSPNGGFAAAHEADQNDVLWCGFRMIHGLRLHSKDSG
jgi:hypothetical protein